MLAYMGPDGTFSHSAALDWSKGNEELVQYKSLPSLIRAVNDGEVDKAIVPIENSIEGSVTTTIDMLALEADVFITGEYILRVKENIMARPGVKREDVKLVISHPQPIGQCSRILKEKYTDVPCEHTASTAQAARLVAESKSPIACIGSSVLAKIYGLEILDEDCADDKNNSTRFVIIEKRPNTNVTDHDKTSIAFTLDNRPGTLYHVIEQLYKSNINMLKIESRPMKDVLGKYVFIVDVEGNTDDANIYFALNEIKRETEYYKFLGSYAYKVLDKA